MRIVRSLWLAPPAVLGALLVHSAGSTPVAPSASATTKIVLTGGTISLDFADGSSGLNETTLDRLDAITWSGGTGAHTGQNYVSDQGNGPCSDPNSFFGESFGGSTSAGVVTPIIIVRGSSSVASNQTATTLTTTTSGLDCDGNKLADATASTDYAVYPVGDPNVNEFRVARTINFSATTPVFASNILRAYIPQLSQEYFIVNYPNAAGTIVSVDNSQCQSACEITDWNGRWFAEDDDSGSGMVVVRDVTSNSPAELFIQFDTFETSDNWTSIALLQPTQGWKAPITEIEWICFYDTSTWTLDDQRAGNLPIGCAQHTAAITDTTPNPFTFTAVTGVPLGSTQASNSVSISGINAAAAVTISGGEYSINGAAFTAAAGTAREGDKVMVRGVSSASYSTATAVVLTLGGVSGTFSITTKAAPAPTVTLTAAPESIAAGQAATLTWSSTNATACAASGAWSGSEATSGTDDESPSGAGTYIFTLTCTGPGGSAKSSVNLVVAPAVQDLSGHVGGGGGLGWDMLIALGLLVLLRRLGSDSSPAIVAAAGLVLFGTAPLRAQSIIDDSILGHVGVRAGSANYQFSASDLYKTLGDSAADIDSISISKHQFGGAVYAGVPIYRGLILDVSYVQLGQFPLSVKASTGHVSELAERVLETLPPAGHGLTAGFALPLELGSTLELEPRLSALLYQSKQVLSSSSASYRDDERGVGVDAGLSLSTHLIGPIRVGAGVDCLHMTEACNVLLFTAQIEYRFVR